MDFPQHFSSLQDAALPEVDLHLAIGIFDGVHLGHQALIESAIHQASRTQGLSGVLTFWPHPSHLFRPEAPTSMILPLEQKAALLHRMGVDVVISQPFNLDFAKTTAEDFVPMLKKHLPHLKALYVGEGFRFGKARLGDVDLLIKTAQDHGITVYALEGISHNHQKISSTWIRELLLEGDVNTANTLLGYPYFTEGKIQEGAGLGGQMGFPTLNIEWSPELKPKYGVYAVRVRFGDDPDDEFEGVANYGVHPTVGALEEPILEVHLFESPQSDVGETALVSWHAFIREEIAFSSTGALKSQIDKDKATARRYFQNKGF